MNKGLKGKKILVTSGPTSVPVDDMRVITNRSTGEMGRILANAFSAAGGDVTLLEGVSATTLALRRKVKVAKFIFFDELAGLFSAHLKKRPDIVIHAAAVSDFRPEKILKGKVPSCDKTQWHLVATPKLINRVKRYAPNALLVGFKFEANLKAAILGARKLFLDAGCDLVVANTQNARGYQARLLCCDGMARKVFRSKKELVQDLLREISL